MQSPEAVRPEGAQHLEASATKTEPISISVSRTVDRSTVKKQCLHLAAVKAADLRHLADKCKARARSSVVVAEVKALPKLRRLLVAWVLA